ncbi:hypothetical protein HOLleu_03612 [Holothuria leucospilota]|uniref:Uncharacterized protein n=1 Tax=Holothuria leucospilota TaxID=206669 RepID=A0A9Q1HLZ4_HOLLE|nr:hypothetical protein HOLleu_03612 [Holothuria leucospilota]
MTPQTRRLCNSFTFKTIVYLIEVPLLLESSIANVVVENAREFNGLHVPPLLKKGPFVFFAIDNADFAEGIADGNGTTHGAITTVYQKANATGESMAPNLKLREAQNLSVR